MPRSAGTHVALLRAVNVGGRNKLPMKDLVAIVEALGGRRVRTYIQSGNVVFDGPPSIGPRLERALGDRLRAEIPVVIRTADEIAAAAADNPFLAAAPDEKALHVAFLAALPRGELDPARSPGDSFAIRGREVYLLLPNGVGRTKLGNDWIESRLGTSSTMRNWRTVLALAELARA